MSMLRRLIGLSRGTRTRLLLAAVIALVVVAANIALLTVAGWFIAAMAAAGLAGAFMNYFTPAAAIRGFAIVRTVGRYLERLISHDATLRLLTRLRGHLYRRLEPLAPAGLERYRKGDLLTRLVGDVDTLDNAYLRIALPVVVAITGSLGAVIVLALSAPVLIPVELGLLAVTGIALPALAHALGRRPGNRAARATGELKAEVLDTLQGLSELELLGATAAKRDAVARLDERLIQAQQTGLHIDATMLSLSTLATGAALWLTFAILEPPAATARIDPLVLPMLVFFVLGSGEIVQGLPGALRALGHTATAATRIFEAMDGSPPVLDPVKPAAAPSHHAIAFEKVGLTYPGQRRPALSGLSFELPEGSALALVGPSGAGKSSVTQLLLRFREYESGAIRVSGRPLREYASDDVRRLFAYVAQSSRLFSTTLRENLRLAQPRAHEAALWTALESAHIAEEVGALPQGLDTFVGTGGVKLSTGQIRRVMLARAFLKNAPVMLLDEPTEGVDAVNERALITSLMKERGNRSLLIITHRLTGLAAADEILVLDRGCVVQQGTHDELLRADGLYRTMASYFSS